jgi:hypothetical protein
MDVWLARSSSRRSLIMPTVYYRISLCGDVSQESTAMRFGFWNMVLLFLEVTLSLDIYRQR